MVNFYKRYIYKNGVKHGPYYYSNKKVNGKVISTYLGTKEPTRFNFKVNPNNKKIVIAFLSLISVALLIYISMNIGLFGTGQSIVDSGTAGVVGSVPGEEINDSNLSAGEMRVDSLDAGKIKEVEETPEIITEQGEAKVNSQVEWRKEVKLKKEGPARVKVPSQATDIVVYSIDDEGNREEVSDSNIGVTAQASSEIILEDEEPGIVRFFKKLFAFLTGKAVTVEEQSDFKEVVINENKNKYEVNYKTPGPTITEEKTDNRKKVVVSSPPGLQFNDVIVYANIESFGMSDASVIRIYWVEQNKYVDYTNTFDTNEDGILDYLEWVSPTADNQTYEIIVVTRAEHLDSNRIFISDVYNEVRDLDDLFTEEIPNGDYVRVTFEKNLTSENDITVFVKIGQGNPRIEVYEENGNEIIASFEDLNDNEYNKILLTNLQGEQDTFDLKIVGGSLFFNHIIDPTATPGGTPDLRAQVCARQSQQANQNTFNLGCAGVYPSSCGSVGDRLSCDDSISETALSNKQGGVSYWAGVQATIYNSLVTNCGSINQVSLCYGFSGPAKFHTCNVGVDAHGGSSWNDVSINCLSIPGINCIDVTSLEPWTCSNFFGPSGFGSRAMAKLQVQKTGGSGTSSWDFDVLYFDVTYSPPNQPPTIISIDSISPQDPTENSITAVVFNVDASDPDGQADIVNVRAQFTRGVEPTREDIDCVYISGTTYECSIDMWYSDEAGIWDVSVTVEDSLGQLDTDNTNTFTYNLLKAIVIIQPVGALSWPTLSQGQTNAPSDNDPNIVRNTGNYEGPIFVTAYNLIGQISPAENIPASNFVADIDTGGAGCSGVGCLECFGATQLQHSTSKEIIGSYLIRGGAPAVEQIYYCLTNVPYISSQAYSATGANSWRIEI